MSQFSLGPNGPYLSKDEYNEKYGEGAADRRVNQAVTVNFVGTIIGWVIVVIGLLVGLPAVFATLTAK